jgi:hypothetical protein
MKSMSINIRSRPAPLAYDDSIPLLLLFFSGGGTVDFQEFVGGLSAFSSRGGREEKLKCEKSLTLELEVVI